jgi:5-methylthioadenosine/S-adenosylhomocysteine deaminase
LNLLIRNGLIVTQDDSRSVLKGSVYVEDGVITEIGGKGRKDDYVIDAAGGAVMPGLINTHTHVAMTEFRGALDDLSLEAFLDKTFSLDNLRTRASIDFSARLSILEMIMSGTTSFLDLYYSEDVIADVCRRAGIRAFLSWVVLDEDKTTQKGKPLTNAENFVRAYAGEPRIKPSVGLQGVYVCSEETCMAARDVASRYETLLHMHLSETRAEVYNHQRRFGSRPVEWLSGFDFFSGIQVVAAHGAWLTRNEMRELMRGSVSIAHCARSNMKLGSGIAPVREMTEFGINVSVGTDSATTSNNLDMFEEMRTASYLQKVSKWDSGILNAVQTLDMATRNGAKALRSFDAIGSLEVGKRADIIILSAESTRMNPLNASNVIANIVYSAQGSDVSTTIVDGRPLLLEGSLSSDLARINPLNHS